ncbi:MAG TPA: beta-propeller fold lactonase family protein [Terracidiphilus sp.]|nr:beta-propeller fold lactonase family protein [Terracidiphilus sp.]
MKFNKSSQLVLVSAASILVAGLMSACASLTVDFVYVASAKAAGPDNYGEINIFEVNSESGKMRQIPASPVPSQGRNPVAEVASADDANLFVANQDDNTIVQFVIGNDGKLYPYNTVNTPGIYPLALAASAANLFVADTFQPLPSCSTAAPCSGSIAVYPLTAATKTAPVAMGSPAFNSAVTGSYWPLVVPGKPSDVIVPTAVSVLPSGAYVYVTAYDSSITPNAGYLFAFAVGSGGVLAPVSGSPFAAGLHPSAIASDPSSKYVYATDYAGNNVLGYSVGGSGALTQLAGSPFKAGNAPSAIAVDQSFSFAYVANSTDATITAYSITNGVLASLGNYTTGLQPVAIGIDPSTNHYLYTANFLGNNVSGFQLNQSTGALLISQSSPYPSNDQPTAVAAIPHNGIGAGVKP